LRRRMATRRQEADVISASLIHYKETRRGFHITRKSFRNGDYITVTEQYPTISTFIWVLFICDNRLGTEFVIIPSRSQINNFP